MDGRLRSTLTTLCLASAVLAPVTVSAEEPTVDQVRAAALSYNRLDGQLDRWSARARWSNLLPKVTGEVGWLDQADEIVAFDEYLTRDGDGALLFDRAHNGEDYKRRDRLHYEVRATIDFRGLLFDTSELRAATEERQRWRDRLEIVEAVHQAYFGRLSAMRDLEEAPSTERRQAAHSVREYEARLDGLTGGWFRAALAGGEQ